VGASLLAPTGFVLWQFDFVDMPNLQASLLFQAIQHSVFECLGIEWLRISTDFAFPKRSADGVQRTVLLLLTSN